LVFTPGGKLALVVKQLKIFSKDIYLERAGGA
jgi:hypothetical protein